MSAYIVGKNHIVFLVQAAMSRRISPHHSWVSWVWNRNYDTGSYSRGELRASDYDRAVEVANMLWCENIKSVSQRYPNESSATGPIEHETIEATDFRPLWDSFEPVDVLKACDCYAYQSCEHDEWRDSEAFAFIEALRSAAWHSLPGYDDAQWGAPLTTNEKRAAYRAKREAA